MSAPTDVLTSFREGNAALRRGRLDQAELLFKRAIVADPKFASAYVNLALCLKAVGRTAEALDTLEAGIRAVPQFAPLWNNRGNLLRANGSVVEAAESYRRAFYLDSGYADALNNCAGALCDLGAASEALLLSERAIGIQANNAEFRNQRGVALAELDRQDEAIEEFRLAAAFDSQMSKPLANMAAALRAIGRTKEATEAALQAVERQPDRAENRYNLSLAQLQLGMWAAGFANYEWRKYTPKPLGARYIDRPMWDGASPVSCKKVLLHAEQGLGDTIQFCRYAISVAGLGAEVLLQVPRRILRLICTLDPRLKVIADDDEAGEFHFHCPLMSLPFLFGTTPETVPTSDRYLRSESSRVLKWRDRIGHERLKIGLVWQGNRNSAADKGRSMPLELLKPIASLPGVRLISLQSGEAVDVSFPVETLGPDFDSGADGFLDTAAALESLDLLVSIDTAVAHLAGALGRPTWLALKVGADWRWLMDRADTPWYPKHRLFRQKTIGDWTDVIDEIVSQLKNRKPCHEPAH